MSLFENEKIEGLSAGQQRFIDAVKDGKNIFLTGKAGTGKSHVVKIAMDILRKGGKKVAAIAPTGVAASNIGGQTIHSLFSIPPFGIMDLSRCNSIRSEKRRLLRAMNTFVVDEASMLRSDMLDAMQWTLRKNGCPGLDQKQIIFVGDMKQLPVILDDNERSVLWETHKGEEFFHAHIYESLNVVEIELDEVQRQSDPEFIAALNELREGRKSQYFTQFIHTEPKGIILAPHNETVKRYNENGLARMDGEQFHFRAVVEGNVKATDFNFETYLNLKSGAPVMYLQNSTANNLLVNGTLGTYIRKDGKDWFRFRNTDFALEPVRAAKIQYVYNSKEDRLELQELGYIEQLPVRLAFALTIHKSQGLTFDEVTVDLSLPAREKAMVYVAMSRVRTPAGLRIISSRIKQPEQ